MSAVVLQGRNTERLLNRLPLNFVPIVPLVEWVQMGTNRQYNDGQGYDKHSVKICPSIASFTTNAAWLNTRMNMNIVHKH
jgi:hypothetical protein